MSEEKKAIEAEYDNAYYGSIIVPPPPPYEVTATSPDTGTAVGSEPGVMTPPPYTPQVPASLVGTVPYVPPAAAVAAPQIPKMTWYERNMHNKPQSNSVGAVSLLFIIAGMNMSWSAFNPYKENAIDWFIGALVGALIGAIINATIKRKYLIMFSSVLTVIDGIIYLTTSRIYGSVTAARYFDGLAIGVVFVPTMVLVGENSVKEMRGLLASTLELMCFYSGIGIQVCFDIAVGYSYPMNSVQVQGVLNVIFGMMAFGIVYYLYIESPIHHLTKGREEMAIDCLRRLQTPLIVTSDTYEQLQEHRQYIDANKRLSQHQSLKQGLPALGLLIFHRSWLAISFSALTCEALMRATEGGLVILYGNLAFISGLIISFMLDRVGRRSPTLVGSIICAGLALALALCEDNVFFIPMHTRFCVVTALLMVYQFCAPISTMASSAYLTEAFPLAVKPYFISIPFVVQMLVQLIISCNFNGASLAAYFYASSAICIVMAIFAGCVLPETKKLSLVNAQSAFKRESRWSPQSAANDATTATNINPTTLTSA